MYVAVYTTVSTIDEAKKIGYNLVQKKLVACVNIIPNVQSIYRWKGKIEEDSEVILWCKTHESLIKDIKLIIQETHPYDLPAFVIYPIHSGSKSYLKWIDDETAS
ncbi:MAG: divalent-cation tolerance protein CutA [Candidatus Hodarchaeota archaeon]